MDDDGRLSSTSKSETTVSGPGHPCMECSHVYSRTDVREAMEQPEYRGEGAYVASGLDPDEQPRAPSVIGANATVAGLIQWRFKGLNLGVTDQNVGIQGHKPAKGETGVGAHDRVRR